MAPRKAVEKEMSREDILEAARKKFVSQGYHAVSMRKIARTLGYSHGALYYHFKNKADLFNALMERDFDLLNQHMDAIGEAPHTVEDILKGFIQFCFTYPHHYELMFMIGGPFLDETIVAVKSYERFAYEVNAASEGSMDLKRIWCMFLSLQGFVSHYVQRDYDYSEVKDLADYYVSLLLKGT